MRRIVISFGVVLLLAVLSVAAVADGICSSATASDNAMTLTGVVTARDGTDFSIRTSEGRDYVIDGNNAKVMLDRLPGNCMSLRVGDKVRVYGSVVSGNRVCASRIHIFLNPSEAESTAMPPAGNANSPVIGTGPTRTRPTVVTTKPVSPDYDVRVPVVGDSLGSWRNRGLVLGVHYGDRMVTMATSMGPFDIDASAATVVAANSSVSLARVSEGDAIRVWGESSGLHKVRADRIEILRGKAQQEAAVPVKNTSVVGQIDYIDYPSFTFRINTGAGTTRVMVDENTFIHFQGMQKAFMDLGLAQKVKVSGIGNMSSGFMATQVQIIGDPGE